MKSGDPGASGGVQAVTKAVGLVRSHWYLAVIFGVVTVAIVWIATGGGNATAQGNYTWAWWTV